jgi:signal transduction histidine kinase
MTAHNTTLAEQYCGFSRNAGLFRTQLKQQLHEIDILRSTLKQEQNLRELEETQIKMILHEVGNAVSLIEMSSFIVSNYFDELPQTGIIDRLAVVKDQTAYLGDLLKNLSDIVSEHGLPTIQSTESIDLRQIAEQCLQELTLQNPSAARIALSVSGDLGGLNSGANALHSILINLLSNSLKYSPDPNPVHLIIQRNAQGILISVRDQGIGIAQADIERVFDPFYRADNAATMPGSGLGLAIVKNSVALLGGTISVESEVNKGTTFTIHLTQLAENQKSAGGPVTNGPRADDMDIFYSRSDTDGNGSES